MYAFPEMIDMTKVPWKSKAHKIVAQNILIGNKRINNLTDLIYYSEIINKIPKNRIKKVTFSDLACLGIPVN